MIMSQNASGEALRAGVFNAHKLLRSMILSKTITMKIPEEVSNDFVCLLLFDAMIVKELNYSYLDDIELSKFGDVTIKCFDLDRFLDTLNFLEKYLDYNLNGVKHLARA